MKKIILLFMLFVFNNSNAQCGFNLDELLNLTVANTSDYETIILTKGYEFNSKTDNYFCGLYKDSFGISKRFQSGKFYGFLYITYSKENYLDIKKRMIDMHFKFKETTKISDTEAMVYETKNFHITLFTKTIDYTPNYNVLIEIDLLSLK